VKRQAWASVGLAFAALLLGACSERADRNSDAPGSPGTGNPTEVAPQTGSSGGDLMPGTTGSGTTEAGERSGSAQSGTGLKGGLGTGTGLTGSFPATAAVGDGGSNPTSRNAVGQR
jgi:hypothetical protein